MRDDKTAGEGRHRWLALYCRVDGVGYLANTLSSVIFLGPQGPGCMVAGDTVCFWGPDLAEVIGSLLAASNSVGCERSILMEHAKFSAPVQASQESAAPNPGPITPSST